MAVGFTEVQWNGFSRIITPRKRQWSLLAKLAGDPIPIKLILKTVNTTSAFKDR